MSFAEFLRGPSPASGGAKKAQRRQHKYEKQSVEKNIELGGRAAAFLQFIWGEDKAEEMLENLAQRANGSQPSAAGDPMIIDLDGAGDADDSQPSLRHCGACLPYGFWRRFMTEDLGTQYTNRKRMSLLRALRFYVQRKMDGASTPAAMRGMRAPNSCRRDGGGLTTLGRRRAWGLHCCSGSWMKFSR